MEPVSIVGVGMTQFGVLKDSIVELAQSAAQEALNDSSTIESPIDYLIVGTQNPEEFTGQGHLSTLLADYIGVVPAGATRVETGPSSGSSAFESAVALVGAGMADLVLVVGVEKMSQVSRSTASRILARMLSYDNEILYGATPTALAALITRRYMHDFGLTRNELSLIPVKAHRNGAKNPLAHFQKEVTIEEVSNSPIIADPLRLYDCCATSDGAAAVVIASDKAVREYGLSDSAIKVLGVGHGTDYLAVQHRSSLTSLNATRVAAKNAFRMAGVEPSNIDVCEVHDAFSILELLNMEDIGLVEKGQAIAAVKNGTTEVSGELPVNPSGGLKARGHPTGGTGVAQIRDIVLQLRGQAPKGLQVADPRVGLTHNIGGFGNNMCVGIFSI
ncbi:MAG: thiolase domain-containing protein [Candidatus Thorarchaeota archaeon]|nr:MAG: thiolase domain-containing protein [Candidatus Thorarchaeota archaeon]